MSNSTKNANATSTPIFQPAFLDLIRDKLLGGSTVDDLTERVAQGVAELVPQGQGRKVSPVNR